MPNTLFSFDELSSKDKAITQIKRQFKKLGATVVSVDVGNIKRKAGENFREIFISFADSQTVTFAIKKTGDIFQVKLNKKEMPIRNQDDQDKAFKEIVAAMDKGRSAFQKKLAKIKTPTISRTTTSSSNRLKAAQEKTASLEDAIQEAKTRIESLQTEIKQFKDDTETKNNSMKTAVKQEPQKNEKDVIKETIQKKMGASSKWMDDHLVIM